jgi:glutamyl-Q tRNA(Asp) synthetase
MNTAGHAKLYIGRFAPSPTGPLHAGSLVAALASWLDARAHQGKWLLRIEDLDAERCSQTAADAILTTLHAFGLQWDGEVIVQSRRTALYQKGLETLIGKQHAYGCICTRKQLLDAGHTLYPGTCRTGLPSGQAPRAWRFKVATGHILFTDRWLGRQSQDTERQVGDFVLKRADGFWAYQLAVVIDDAMQGVTDVVRGADLLDSTGRQMHLQQALGYAPPRYLHVPVVVNENGEKLSKQTLAPALSLERVMPALVQAASHLGLTDQHLQSCSSPSRFLERALPLWAASLSSRHLTTSPPGEDGENLSA